MRDIPEWIADSDDAAIPPRVRLRIFEKYKGRCPKCTRNLYSKKWECDHITALANGGQHRESNLQPLCISPCHSDKTRNDVRQKSRSAKRRKRNSGIEKPRTIRVWRRFDGTPVHAPRER